MSSCPHGSPDETLVVRVIGLLFAAAITMLYVWQHVPHL